MTSEALADSSSRATECLTWEILIAEKPGKVGNLTRTGE